MRTHPIENFPRRNSVVGTPVTLGPAVPNANDLGDVVVCERRPSFTEDAPAFEDTPVLVPGLDQHLNLNTLGGLELQGLVEEKEVIVRVLSLDSFNLKKADVSEQRTAREVSENHTPPCNSVENPRRRTKTSRRSRPWPRGNCSQGPSRGRDR